MSPIKNTDTDFLFAITVCFGLLSMGVFLAYFIEWGVPSLWQVIRTLTVVFAANMFNAKRMFR